MLDFASSSSHSSGTGTEVASLVNPLISSWGQRRRTQAAAVTVAATPIVRRIGGDHEFMGLRVEEDHHPSRVAGSQSTIVLNQISVAGSSEFGRYGKGNGIVAGGKAENRTGKG
ncbi:hypothetical protein SO802_030320 [Lithocarpus litseifolius]|uniref:Uncharacterized protein n=1 Tax=Lithocarpus litseifolius TaxID=425828 RepID=A0AAW2BKP7_9ROSI